jgi:hypothetical protein
VRSFARRCDGGLRATSVDDAKPGEAMARRAPSRRCGRDEGRFREGFSRAAGSSVQRTDGAMAASAFCDAEERDADHGFSTTDSRGRAVPAEGTVSARRSSSGAVPA